MLLLFLIIGAGKHPNYKCDPNYPEKCEVGDISGMLFTTPNWYYNENKWKSEKILYFSYR